MLQHYRTSGLHWVTILPHDKSWARPQRQNRAAVFYVTLISFWQTRINCSTTTSTNIKSMSSPLVSFSIQLALQRCEISEHKDSAIVHHLLVSLQDCNMLAKIWLWSPNHLLFPSRWFQKFGYCRFLKLDPFRKSESCWSQGLGSRWKLRPVWFMKSQPCGTELVSMFVEGNPDSFWFLAFSSSAGQNCSPYSWEQTLHHRETVDEQLNKHTW